MTLGANQIGAYAADLFDLEEKIDQLQTGKRNLYKAIRDEHGKGEATSLKLAVKLSRMDDGKRSEAEAIDTEAQRMLAIIAKGRAPRATRESARDVPDQSSDLRNMVESTAQNTSNSGYDSAENSEFGITHNSEPATHAADRGGEGDPNPALSAEPLPETADEIDREEDGSPETGHLSSGKRPEGNPAQADAGAVSDAEAGENPAAISIQSDDPTEPAGEGPNTLAGRPNSEPVDTTRRNSKGIRKPDVCQRVENCGVMGWRTPCTDCQQAHADEMGFTA